MMRSAIGFALISWTIIFTVPGSKSDRDGLVLQRGIMGGYATEAACKAKVLQLEAEWRKEGDDVDRLGRNPSSPLPKCVENKPKL